MSGSVAYPDIVWEVLHERFAPLRNASKVLARMVGVSPRTAENWLTRENAPQGEQLLTLMAECDGLAERIMAEVERRKVGK